MSGERDRDAWSTEFQLTEITLDQFQPLVDRHLPEPTVLAGQVSGNTSFRSSADGSDGSGKARIDSTRMTPAVRRRKADFVVGHEGLKLDVELTAKLIPEASVEANVSGGQLDVSAPPSGNLTIDGVEAFLATLGLQLSDGFARLTVDESGAGEIKAALRSGDGRIEVSSKFAATDGQAELRVRGENSPGMNTEQVVALVSPDLTIKATPQLLTIRGVVEMPLLDIDLTSFEGSVSGSPDVVVVGREQESTRAPHDLDVELCVGETCAKALMQSTISWSREP